MDYNKLYTFTKVAELGSITSAARALRRTQSAITQQVQQLESDLGLQLFERRQARLQLSREGASLYQRARRALGEIDDLVATLCDDVRTARGRLRIAALNDLSTEIDLTRLVASFRAAYPGVDISVVSGSNARVEAMLLSGEADLGLAIVFAKKGDLARVELATATHALVGARRYLDARRPIRTYRDVVDADLIDFTDDFVCLEPWFRANKPELAASLLHRTPNIVLPDHRATRDAVLAGLGLGIIPLHLVAKELESGAALRILPSARDLRVGLDLAWLEGRELRLIEQLFRDMAIAASRG